MEEFKTLDSGEREVFETGSQRDSRVGKGRFDLLPWECIERWALLMERGAEKYSANNWKLGQPLNRLFDSGIRHAYKWYRGDTDEDHLAAVLFNFGAIMWTEEQIKLGKLPKELENDG